MSDPERPVWEMEESVEARAEPAFAFRYLTSIENVEADPGIERIETDGPYRDRVGMRGTTHLAGGGTNEWVVSAVEPGRRFVIDLALRDAFLRFEFRFEDRAGGGSVVSQRISLFGPNAAEYLEGVAAGFGTTLGDGMRAVRDRIDAALSNPPSSPTSPEMERYASTLNPEEKLDETIEETFPASDAPGNTPETGIRVRIDAGSSHAITVRDNAAAERFEIAIEDQIAFLEYKRKPGTIVLVHTEVPPALRGRGLANVLTEYALRCARAERLHVTVICPFVRAYRRKHPEV